MVVYLAMEIGTTLTVIISYLIFISILNINTIQIKDFMIKTKHTNTDSVSLYQWVAYIAMK